MVGPDMDKKYDSIIAAEWQEELRKLGINNPEIERAFKEAIASKNIIPLKRFLTKSGLLQRALIIKHLKELLMESIPYDTEDGLDGPIYIGETPDGQRVGLNYRDFLRHISVDGTTGTGKTSIVRNIVKALIDEEEKENY